MKFAAVLAFGGENSPTVLKSVDSKVVAFVPDRLYDLLNPYGVPRLIKVADGKLADAQEIDESTLQFYQRTNQ